VALILTMKSMDLDIEMRGKTRVREALAFSVNVLSSKGVCSSRIMRKSKHSDTLRSDRKLVLERALSSKTQLDVRSGSKKSGFGNNSIVRIEMLMVCKGHREDG